MCSSRRPRGRAARIVAVVLTAALTVSAAGVSGASPEGSPVGRPLADSVRPAVVDEAGLRDGLSPRLNTARGEITAFVELAGEPAVRAFNARQAVGGSDAKEAARSARRATESEADAVVADLRARDANARLLTTTSNAVPGAVVAADAAALREIEARANVLSVRPVVPKQRTNSGALQLTETLTAWQRTGRLGDGIRIGIIDDGIDYTHADFGGPGTKAAYEEIDPDKAAPAYFPNEKVVGGIDLAGDDYDNSGTNGSPVPQPDPNPISCGHHGTHVAGTAGGFGVNADGSTFTGDYSKLTPETIANLRIGPGSAPKSLLYAIKVFGCAGSTSLTSKALDWALDPDGDGDFSDRLDVVNLSLGSNYGAPDDPDSLFVRKLAAHDVLAVISGGNGGDLYDVGGAPGNTPEALTVASARDASVVRDAAEVIAPQEIAGRKPGQFSQNFEEYDDLDLTGEVVPLAKENADGCAPFSETDRAAVEGKIVWLEWEDDAATRECGSVGRTDNAEAAGAEGVLLSSTRDRFAAGIAGNAGIPVFQLTATATKALRPALSNGSLRVRLGGDGRAALPTKDESLKDTPSDFTSRGVRAPSVKPDVAAPGDTIASALSGSGNGRAVLSGTSMAAPYTAGVAALVRQAHPDWSVEEVKAAVTNTAGHDVHDDTGHTYAPQRVGAGRIDARAALATEVLARVRDEPGTVSATFGTVEVARPVSLSKTIEIVNKGDRRVEFGAAYEQVTEQPGVRYELSGDSVTLDARDSATLTLTLVIDDPTALRKTADPTIEMTQRGLARQFLADVSGSVVFTPRGEEAVELRVPVYAAPKPVAEMTAASRLSYPEQQSQAVLKLDGRAVEQGAGSSAYRSLVSAFELHATSGRLPRCEEGQTAACTMNETARAGDLRYVGATSTAPLAKRQGDPENALLAFGIATWGDWANLGSNTIPFVGIDTTGDGKPDFESYVTKAPGTDLLLVNTVDLNRPGTPSVDIQAVNGQLGDVDTNVFDTNVVMLLVDIAALGIDPAADSHRISYTVGIAGYYATSDSGVIDSVREPLSFDPLAPAYSMQGGDEPALSFSARPGTALLVNRAADAGADDVPGLLVLHHHNREGHRASVVRLPRTGTAGEQHADSSGG